MDTNTLPRLDVGSVDARCLKALWEQAETVVVESPPGGGKTNVVVTVASWLAKAGVSTTIAVTSYAQLDEVLARFARIAPDTEVVAMLSAGRALSEWARGHFAAPKSWKEANTDYPAAVRVTVLAKLVAARQSKLGRVLIIDEAWQATTTDARMARRAFEQAVLVGDSGQIPVIVTSDIDRWESGFQPFVAAPDDPTLEAVRLNIERTRRLGPDTTSVIRSFYGFGFHSERYPTEVVLGGSAIPEIVTFQRSQVGEPNDADLISAVVARAVQLADGQIAVTSGGRRTVTDVAQVGVVVPRVQQVTLVASMLNGYSDRIVVDTANSLQGTEYDAVVAVDPMFGHVVGDETATEPGRLCVALSRHRGHLSFFTSAEFIEAFEADDDDVMELNASVRRRLMEVSG